MLGWQPIAAGIKKVTQHSEQVKIDEPWALVQEVGFVEQHLLEREEAFLELGQERLLLAFPILEATAPKFSLFEADELELVLGGEDLPPVDVIEAEAETLNFVFDMPPQNGLDPFEFPGEQAQMIFGINVLGDDLGIIAYLKDDGLAVADNGDAIVAFAGELPDPGTVAVGDIGDFEAGPGKFEDAALNDAEGTPRKLNEFDHFSQIWSARANSTDGSES